jgi:hypothetical protein
VAYEKGETYLKEDSYVMLPYFGEVYEYAVYSIQYTVYCILYTVLLMNFILVPYRWPHRVETSPHNQVYTVNVLHVN